MIHPARQAFGKVSDYVRALFPAMRFGFSETEASLATHLRGNERLYNDLTAFLRGRIEGRARTAEPSDPLVCKSMLARDREVQFLLGRLDLLYRSPVNASPDVEDGEQPEE